MNKTSKRRHPISLVRQIKLRMLTAVCLLVLALLFNFLVGLYVSNRQYDLGEQKVALQEARNGILIAMLNQETGLRGYIVSGNTAFLEPFNSGRPQYLLAVQYLKDHAHSTQANDFSRTNTTLAQVEARANDWYSNYALVQINRVQSGNLAVARSQSIVAVGKGKFDTFRASEEQLRQAIDHDLNNIQMRVVAFDTFVLIIAFLLSAIAIFILGYTFNRFVNVLLEDLNIFKAATKQRGSGDLSARVRDLTYDELNQLGQTFNTMADVLQRRQNVLQFQRDKLTTLNAALEEANQARSQFYSTMSHELRTPLASIIGFSQMLLDDAGQANLTQRQKANVERILKNGHHLHALINDVLDLAKIEAGRMDVSYTQVDVRELLSSVVEEIQSMAILRNLVLRAEVAEGVDYLESNAVKLRQILLNLISNAIKFTEQGEVIVSARRVNSSEQEADHIAFAVKDTGMGIPAEVQEHIFEAFYQVDGNYTRKFGGTGLGLSIVSQLTVLLGGKIEVASAPGQGSTFTVLLPIKAAQQQVVERDTPRLHPARLPEVLKSPPSSDELMPELLDALLAVSANREAVDGQHNLVLTVDNNADDLRMIESALQDTPYTVLGVQDPLKALELVQELRPCAITLDVMMPDVNGWQILHQLKANPATASIPVVMISVLSERTTGYVLGADDYLIKPFKSDVLRETLEHLIASPKGPAQASQREAQAV